MKVLNPTQAKLLALIAERQGDLRELSLRDIAAAIGVGPNPQPIVHHLAQLEKKGLLRRDPAEPGVFHRAAHPTPNVAPIRLLAATAECGPDGRFGEDGVIDWIPLPTKTFGIADPDRYFLVRARGESMAPLIRDGDLVLALTEADVEQDAIAVVVHEGMPKIKKLDKAHRVLISLNPSYPLEYLAEGGEARIIGPVKGVIRTGKLL